MKYQNVLSGFREFGSRETDSCCIPMNLRREYWLSPTTETRNVTAYYDFLSACIRTVFVRKSQSIGYSCRQSFCKVERTLLTMPSASKPKLCISSSACPDSPKRSLMPIRTMRVGWISERHSATAPPKPPAT